MAVDDKTIFTAGLVALAYVAGVITNYVTKRREGQDARQLKAEETQRLEDIDDRRAIREVQAQLLVHMTEERDKWRDIALRSLRVADTATQTVEAQAQTRGEP
jgi:hypothetical protein